MKRMQKVYLIGVLLFAFISSFSLFFPRYKDRIRFQKMVRKKALSSSLSSAYNPTQQQRSKVRKEIWLAEEDGTRLHYRVESQESLLTLTPVNNTFEVVEHLKGMTCWIQEKLTVDGQQARYFEAENGLYSYHSSELIAQNAALSFYHLKSQELPRTLSQLETPYLKGIAQNVSLNFGSKTPEFKASHFKALLKELK